jgi:DNA (cytosine-5)-methyltransferase 1
VAGKQEGLEKGETRSGLVWEALRLIGECQPRVAICENVKNLISAKFNYSFSSILRTLDEMGYNSYVEVLNAKDFGVPQNRERVFIVSIRKDCDNGEFKFPVGMDCGIRLKDVLEETVDEKYYISSEKVEQFLATNTLNKNSEGINMLGLLDIKGNEQVRRVYGTEGLSPTLNTMGGGNRQPKVLQYPRIRKLTPLECWRLMGFTDKDFYKAKFTGNSNTQLYKQAGNSIVVNVLEEIFVKLYEGGIFGGNNL